MTQLLDDLRALDALFSDESKWTQRHMIVHKNDGTEARCLRGGCWAIAKTDVYRFDALYAALVELLADLGRSLILFNDSHGRLFTDIKALIARAIATEEGRVT